MKALCAEEPRGFVEKPRQAVVGAGCAQRSGHVERSTLEQTNVRLLSSRVQRCQRAPAPPRRLRAGVRPGVPRIGAAAVSIESIRNDSGPLQAGHPSGGVSQCQTHLRRRRWTRFRACCCITPRCAATVPPRARRTSGSGRPGPGRRSPTRCARSPAGWRRSASSAATTSRSSATTARACTGRWPRRSALGGVPVPLYQDAVAEEMVFVLQDADIQFAIVEDQEQVDKLLEITDRCPQLEHIVYDDPRGLRHYTQPFLHSLRGHPGDGPRAPRQRTRISSTARSPRPARRRGGHALHLRHHRQAEGRLPDPRTRSSPRRAAASNSTA